MRLIFEMYAGGSSYERVAKHLNAAGVEPPQTPRKKGIRSWCPSAIRDMLLNERYRGVLIYGRMRQEAKDPETGKGKEAGAPHLNGPCTGRSISGSCLTNFGRQ